MWISVAVLISIVGLSAGQTLSPKDQMTRLAYANNNFGLTLHRKLAENDGNIFFSPFSVSSVLTMLYRGSRGETASVRYLHILMISEELLFKLDSILLIIYKCQSILLK